LKDFVDKKLDGLGDRVEVEYIRGLAPQLRVFAGKMEDVVPIGSWKSEHLDEFIATRLAKE
jgi:hypothetical protein